MAKKKIQICFWLEGDDCVRTLEAIATEKCKHLKCPKNCPYFLEYIGFNGLKRKDYGERP